MSLCRTLLLACPPSCLCPAPRMQRAPDGDAMEDKLAAVSYKATFTISDKQSSRCTLQVLSPKVLCSRPAAMPQWSLWMCFEEAQQLSMYLPELSKLTASYSQFGCCMLAVGELGELFVATDGSQVCQQPTCSNQANGSDESELCYAEQLSSCGCQTLNWCRGWLIAANNGFMIYDVRCSNTRSSCSSMKTNGPG